MRNFLRRTLLFSSLLLFVSCGSDQNNQNPAASKLAVRAADAVGESFSVVRNTGEINIKIEKNALEKEFLLQTNFVAQPVAAMGNGLKSRVVAFSRRGGSLFMLEATKGHTVTHDIPQRFILAQFPIVSESDTAITFDFNKGMSKIFVGDDWRAQDSEGSEYDANFNSVKVGLSYLNSAKLNPKNQLAMEQVAQIDANNENAPVAVKYYLQPYRPDPTFKPTVSKDFKKTGFFEVAPLLQLDGSTKIWATKFHLDHPIVFAVSANTPPEYKQAVREGILYWNHAFSDKQPIQVVDAPKGVSAPDVNYNVVQWVPHDRAGYAYADAQMDPRTGQILHAQTYITSFWAVSGKADARRLLGRLRSGAADAHWRRYSLKGFTKSAHSPHCLRAAGKQFREGLEKLLSSDAADSVILKASQDIIRSTVAHEVGHLLGLRHNFAGSLHTKAYPLRDRYKTFTRYLAKSEVGKEVSVTSSIMDYLPFQEDAIAGHQMKAQNKIYEYDAKAIHVLYEGKEYKRSELPLFCTDTHKGRFVDCNQYDAGASVLEFKSNAANQALRDLPYKLIETYIAHVAPGKGEWPVRAKEVSLSPKFAASSIFSPRTSLVNAFGNSNQFLGIYYSFPYVGPLNKKEVKKKVVDYVTGELGKLGGLEKIFEIVPAQYYKKTLEKFETLARSDLYRKGVGLAGQPYELSDADIQDMVASVERLLEELPKAVTNEDLSVLNSIPDSWKRLSYSLGGQLATLLKKRMDEYLLAVKEGESIKAKVEVPTFPADKKKDTPTGKKVVDVELPVFFYALDARKKAANLLDRSSDDEGIDWGLHERREIKETFTKKLAKACQCDIRRVKAEKVKVLDVDPTTSREVTLWFLHNKKVLKELD